MTKSRRRRAATQKLAATGGRTFRNLVLMSVFEAKEIGQRIAEARTIAGLTQEDLAGMASFSKRSLQDYEAGVTIPYKHMRELARLLNRSTDWFLHGEGQVSQDRLAATEERLMSALEELRDLVIAQASLLEAFADRLEDQAKPSSQPSGHS